MEAEASRRNPSASAAKKPSGAGAENDLIDSWLVSEGGKPKSESPSGVYGGETVGRLVALVEDAGIDTVARLWADAPAVSLGGALWRLYALRTATTRNGQLWASWYRSGHDAHVARAIAGAAPITGRLPISIPARPDR